MLRKGFLILISVVLIFTLTACTMGVSTGGASLETGYDRSADGMKITNSSTTFVAGEEFYFVFTHGKAFNANVITLDVFDVAAKALFGSVDFEVTPSNNVYSNSIWITTPGKYRLTFVVDGKVSAMQEIIIK